MSGLHAYTASVLLAFVATTPVTAQRPHSIPATRGRVEVTAALVGANMEVRPLALVRLEVVRRGDSGHVAEWQTNLRGLTGDSLPAGGYRIRSLAPVEMDGKRYTWDLEVTIRSGAITTLELTNANAKTELAEVAPALQRQTAPELVVYQRSRGSVFRVLAGLKGGTGFLVSQSGLVLTNAHVVAGELEATVMLDSVRRVPATILYRDREQDVAVLRINAVRAVGLQVLELANAAGGAVAQVGERVLAIGFPLHQEQTLTTGIVSNVRAGAIISDVNINHGNSGGPLLTLDGRVVAINAFGDVSPDRAGPGVSGSINISLALPVLDSARSIADTAPAPDSTYLPILPREAISLAAVRHAADSADLHSYQKLDGFGFLGFQVVTTTPVATILRRRALDADVSRDRHRREARANIPEEQRYSEILTDFEWTRYVGDERAPVVSFSIQPKLGETTGSIFTRALLTGPYGRQTVRYKGDVQAVFVYRNNERVTPLLAGRAPVQAYENNMWIDLRDVAYAGYVALSPELFRPDSLGTPPVIQIGVTDLKNDGKTFCKEIPREIVAAVWNEFIPWLQAHSPGAEVRRSDPRLRLNLSRRVPVGCLDQYGTAVP